MSEEEMKLISLLVALRNSYATAVEPQKDAFIIKPRQFLGSEIFARIAAIVREAGGTYISDKKNSRFEIPKGK